MRSDTIVRIMKAVEHARSSHPWHPGYPDSEKFRYAQQELNEMSAAMLKGNKRQIINEALDLVGLVVRIIEGDGENEHTEQPREETRLGDVPF